MIAGWRGPYQYSSCTTRERASSRQPETAVPALKLYCQRTNIQLDRSTSQEKEARVRDMSQEKGKHESGKSKARVRKKQGTSQEKTKHESGKSGTSQEKAKHESGKRRHESGKRKHESGNSTTSQEKAPQVRKKKARVRKKQTTIQEKDKLELGKRPSTGDSESRIHKLGFRN